MADEALELITYHAESIMEALEIPYQRVLLSTGDLGFSSSRTNDIEAWFPSQNDLSRNIFVQFFYGLPIKKT